MRFTRLFGLLFAATLLAGILSGCNTMEGLGEDMEALGQKVQRGADKHDGE